MLAHQDSVIVICLIDSYGRPQETLLDEVFQIKFQRLPVFFI